MDRFIEYYLPENHWLTKSMEFSKMQDLGTYWHLKKFIVFYYYIFIKGALEKNELIEISNIFNNFIDSLTENQRVNASNYFFEVDLRNTDEIITLNEFTSAKFYDESENSKAKKFYFVYLMGYYQQIEDKRLIFDYTIAQRNYALGIEKATAELIIQGVSEKTIEQQIRDVYSTLRNERQILFILGLVNFDNARSEKYSPTSVGRHLINSNFHEFVLLMEIQKIRHVSRNPLVYYATSTNRPRNRRFDIESDSTNLLTNFDIKRHPYLLYLKYLKSNKRIDLVDYRYLISRTTDKHDEDLVINKFDKRISQIQESVIEKDNKYIIKGVNNITNDPFGPEDFSKENKKYFLGLIDMINDDKNSFFYVADVKGSSIELIDESRLTSIINAYEQVCLYLDSEYEELYEKIKSGHFDKYKSLTKGEVFNKNSMEHLDLIDSWLNYFVGFDQKILQILLVEIIQYNNLTDQQILAKFPYFLRMVFGIRKRTNLLDEIKGYSIEEENLEIIEYIIPNKITLQMLDEESLKYKEIMNDFSKDRKRNRELIRKYISYVSQNSNNNLICEMTGEKLEIKSNGLPIGDVHHIIPFNEDVALGPDHYLNLVLISPNCHRLIHSGNLTKEKYDELYNGISKYSYLNEDIRTRVKKLEESGYLYPSSIDYAKKKYMI